MLPRILPIFSNPLQAILPLFKMHLAAGSEAESESGDQSWEHRLRVLGAYVLHMLSSDCRTCMVEVL